MPSSAFAGAPRTGYDLYNPDPEESDGEAGADLPRSRSPSPPRSPSPSPPKTPADRRTTAMKRRMESPARAREYLYVDDASTSCDRCGRRMGWGPQCDCPERKESPVREELSPSVAESDALLRKRFLN